MSDPTQFVSALELATYFNGTTNAGDLEPAWVAQANLLLQMVSADIEAAAGCPIEAVSTTLLLAGTWSRDLEIAGNLRAVSALAINGTALAAGAYTWNQRSIIRVGADTLEDGSDFEGDWCEHGLQGATWRSGGHWGGPASTITADVSLGFEEVPTFVKALALRIAARTFGNVGQVTQETLAIYSVSYGASTNTNDGSHVTAKERKRLRQLLGTRAGTFQTAGR